MLLLILEISGEHREQALEEGQQMNKVKLLMAAELFRDYCLCIIKNDCRNIFGLSKIKYFNVC